MKAHKRWIQQLEIRRRAISNERDKLRMLIEECEGLEECSIRAYESIDYAIQALSEMA